MLEFWHTYNRSVEKRKIFLEDMDYLRGVHDLYEFNDTKLVFNLNQRFNGPPRPIIPVKLRERLMNIIVWCLMPNHYHLFSCSATENGLSRFHQKFGAGFANFFNIKYKRNGALFQGRYKKVLVTNDTQALQLICYIHSNPLELWKPKWKESGLTNSEVEDALEFLEKKHRWSSHLDWRGIKNFPSLIDTDFMHRFFKTPAEYREFFISWLRYYSKNVNSIQKFILE